MSALALQLIEKEKQERTGRLDLGKCGLMDLEKEVPELFELVWLEELILSNKWWDWEKKSWVESQNMGNNNYIYTLSPSFAHLAKLKRMECGGDYQSRWSIQDIRVLEKLTALSYLDLSYNQIEDIRVLEKLTDLSYLDLSYNQTGDIRVLEKLTALSYLDLSSNKIQDIRVLEKLTSLSTLDLRSNKIQNYSFLEKLTNLSYLDLRSNKIQDIRFLEKLTNLSSLNLRSNQIQHIRFLEKLTNLSALDLSDNQIQDIRALEKLTNLSALDLSDNQIQDIRALEKLTNLTALDLHYNLIQDVSILKKLTNLFSLNLRSNQIQDTDSLVKLANLFSLDLSKNRIQDIFFSGNLVNLSSLNLSYNKIQSVHSLGNLTNLSSLDLSSNQIQDIRFLEKLTNLSSLDLSSNQIQNIRFLEKLINLSSLDLSSNQIQDIRFLKKLTNLSHLNLSSNKVKDIRFLQKLTNLSSLDLSSNKIQNIAPTLKLIEEGVILTFKESGGGINLYKNPLTTPPPEVIKEGNEAVLNYFKELGSGGEDYLFEAKLLILGESGAGKTTFAKKIQSNNAQLPHDSETTRGIEVGQWRFDLSESDLLGSAKSGHFTNKKNLEGALRQGFRTNLWDFGGQEIYHATHRFFFSHRSFYVLIANARQQDTDFNYWMNVVEQLGGESPLLVVVNEKQAHRWRIDERGLRGRFVFFKEVMEVNFGDSQDIVRLDLLRKRVRSYLIELPHIGDKLPARWTKIRQALLEENKPFISFDRYRELCSRYNMTDVKQVLHLSQYFHDIGVFLHFQDDPILKNRIFLDANWTAGTIYALLNDQEIKNNKGRFGTIDTSRIWPDTEIQLMQHELLQLLERFNLAYRIDKSEQFIAPEHLAEPKPYSEWEYESDLLMLTYEFDAFMPKGLITELIVELHRYIPDHNRVWRKGVVLNRENAWAEIIEVYGNAFRIDIKIAGSDKKEFLTVICETFDHILERFPKLHREKLVPCNCDQCRLTQNKSFYKLSDLKDRLKYKKDTVECPKNGYEPTYILSMLEETFDLRAAKKIDVYELIASNKINSAIDILESSSDVDLKYETAELRRRLLEAEQSHFQGSINIDEMLRIRAKVAAEVSRIEKQKP